MRRVARQPDEHLRSGLGVTSHGGRMTHMGYCPHRSTCSTFVLIMREGALGNFDCLLQMPYSLADLVEIHGYDRVLAACEV